MIGNWKMNPSTLGKAVELYMAVRKGLPKKNAVTEVSIAVPFPFLSELSRKNARSPIALCAQDVSFESEGAHTGEVSIAMLKSVGVSAVIAGHSERRAQGESNEEVAKNVHQILKYGLIAIACVGEKSRDMQGDYFGVVETQLRTILKDIKQTYLSRLVIAYEPVWAIGTGKNATAEDVQEMKLFIQKVIAQTVGRQAVAKVRILYGGSVTKENAQELLKAGETDGFLVGGASLRPAEFCQIITIASAYGKI